MSEKEKRLSENISRLPKELQDRFVDQITGAAMALDLLAGEGDEDEEDEK